MVSVSQSSDSKGMEGQHCLGQEKREGGCNIGTNPLNHSGQLVRVIVIII